MKHTHWRDVLRKIPWATLAGLGLLVLVLSRLPLKDSLLALTHVNWTVVPGLLMGPLQITVAVGVLRDVLAALDGEKPAWRDTIALNMEAGAVGRVFPISYSGDLYRGHWLARQQPLSRVSQALLVEELINLSSAYLLQGALAALIVLWPPWPFLLENPWRSGLIGGGAWQLFLTVLVSVVAVSRLPGKLGQKLGGLVPGARPSGNGGSAQGNFPASTFARLNVIKFLDRVLAFGQIAFFAHALGLAWNPWALLTVCAALWTAASVTGFIPHQLGVEEAVLASIFPLLGWPEAAGLGLALLRRADQILWAAVGLLLSGRRGLTRKLTTTE